MLYQSNEHCRGVNPKYRFTFNYYEALGDSVEDMDTVNYNYIFHDLEF